MNCNYLTKTSTASLFRNGILIARASANFTIRCCDNIDLNLGYSKCRCNNRVRVCAFLRNCGDCNLDNLIVRFTIDSQDSNHFNNISRCQCDCNNENSRKRHREICIRCINVNCTEAACIDFFKCQNKCYRVRVQIISNGVILKEDSILV